ncbi:MAG: hypothetical protein KatS3mg070_0132 [Meiothermus sp.]|uniref:hypothetical protein n=1 Tax=Meiothermus sp. TaxID=1955249 RepID=UPI0021DDA2FD|nr:hypothetical protein [Meiothermus sp.]GIW26769.1 MAG: hypothetical protein KatS3mg070_0132 [Meiothermus sp.]
MAVAKVHSSYILRLTQRLSRLTYELRDVRTGQVRQFESARELSSYLETMVMEAPPEPVKGRGR